MEALGREGEAAGGGVGSGDALVGRQFFVELAQDTALRGALQYEFH